MSLAKSKYCLFLGGDIPTVFNLIHMSYDTTKVLEIHGLSEEDFNSLGFKKKKELFYQALKQELPLGLEFMENLIQNFKKGKRDEGQERLMFSADPNSNIGKQVIRLLFDIPRQVLSDRYQVAIGGYNCCSPIIALTKEDLNMSLEEQFMLQSTPDC